MATKTESQALAVTQRFVALAEPPRDVADMLLAASGGQRLSPFDLDVIKVPSGQGAALWSIPTLSGEDDTVRTLEGIVIVQRSIRSYWSASMEDSGGGSPPDCTSQDGVVGRGDPGGECVDCPMAQFGSALKGSGQACKANTLLFLLQPDSLVPMVVKAPPTSLKPLKSFMYRLMNERIPMFGAVLSFGLQKMKGSGTPDYYQIVPSLVRRLDETEATQVKALRDALLPVLAGVRMDVD